MVTTEAPWKRLRAANLCDAGFVQGSNLERLNKVKGRLHPCEEARSVTSLFILKRKFAARRATESSTTLYDDYGAPRWCSVDPVSGNLAVMNEGNEIGIWTGAQGSPTFYTIGALADNASCAYDDNGDLFIVGLAQKTNATTLVEMPYGSNSFTTITLNHTPKGLPLGLQWSGSSLALGFFRERTIYLINVSGSSGTVVKKVHVSGLYQNQFQGWVISGSTLISATRPRSEECGHY